MKSRTIYPFVLLMFCVSFRNIDAQVQPDDPLYGVGINYGIVFPKTDIKASDNFIYGRGFIRYFPKPQFSLEAGIGLGTLQAQTDSLFSTTPIYTIDARLIVQFIKSGKFTTFAYAGMGLMNFNPVDRSDQPLPRNTNGEYGHMTGFFPLGVGAQYFIGDNIAFGVSAGYNYTLSDNIDDIKTGGKDYYWSVLGSLFTYLRPANNDLDGDKLLNDEEKKIGTNPLNPDTDGDGLRDGEEVYTYHTSPLNKDTDGDGLNDKEEIFTYKTDPLKRDTDNDGLTDGEEVLTYHTDPLKMDTDGDGLGDGDEVLKYHTDPLKIDTDGDQLTDGDEVLKYHTNPLKIDTDGDGLTDWEEEMKYKTDPLVMDTDKGGIDDGKEVQLNLNPLDPSDDVPIIKVGERIILEGVNFQTAKTTLLPEAKRILDQVAQSLLGNPNVAVAIHGHTDNVGGAKYNMNLSLGRANAVKDYLVSKGINPSRVTAKGFGYAKPIADNANAAGRAKNRRIEFIRLK